MVNGRFPGWQRRPRPRDGDFEAARDL